MPASISLDAVRESIEAIPGIISVHELHIWQLSESKIVASVHVLVNQSRSAFTQGKPPVAQVVHSALNEDNTITPQETGAPGNEKEGSSEGLLYMNLAADIRKVLHTHGIHSCTIQPEFRADEKGTQSVSVLHVRWGWGFNSTWMCCRNWRMQCVCCHVWWMRIVILQRLVVVRSVILSYSETAYLVFIQRHHQAIHLFEGQVHRLKNYRFSLSCIHFSL